MRHTFRRHTLILGTIWMALGGWAMAAEPSPARLQSRLDELHTWLGNGPEAQQWQSFLKSPQLVEQLAQGPQADRVELARILSAYNSGAPGLERERFRAVRDELALWMVALQPPPAVDLPAMLRAEKGQFVAPSEERVAALRRQVQQSAAELDRFLARGGPASRSGWHAYLNWDILREQLALDTPDLEKLNSVLQRLYSDADGMELAPFRNLRKDLHEYMNTLLVHMTPAMANQFDEELEKLATELEAYASEPSSERAQTIGRSLGWFTSAGQIPELVATIRRHYSHPNLKARVSARFASAAVEGPIDELTSVNDVILGTTINGTARTVGNLSLMLVPDDQRATLDIYMRGAAYSNNMGFNRGVQIHSTGVTSIAAVKRIYVDASGIHSLPANANCATDTTIHSICHNCKLIENIARKRASKQQGQAESVGSQRAARRVEGRMNAQTNDMLAEPQQRFFERFRDPLLRRGEFPQQLDFSTTFNEIMLTMMQANSFQLAAPGEAPPLDESQDLSLRLHESFVGNFSEAAIGGFTLTDERLVELLEEGDREVPEELRIDPNKDPWSITFATNQPIRVEFTDQRVKIVIRGRRFTRGEQVVSSEMDIWAVYLLTRSPEGAKLTREGEVQAEYTMGGFENAAKIAVKTLMRNKFDALFKPEIAGDGIQLEGRLGEAGPLKLGYLEASQGWLSVGWSLPGSQQATAGAEAAADPQSVAQHQ